MDNTAETLRSFAYSDSPILIYGAGRYGRLTLQQFESYGIQVTGFLDGDAARHNTLFLGKPVFPFDTTAIDIANCHVVISVNTSAYPEVLPRLRSLGVPEHRLYTKNFIYQINPAFDLVNNVSIDRHLEMYSLSRYLQGTDSLRIFRQRYRHAILRDTPHNDSMDSSALRGAVVVDNPSAPLPAAACLRYPNPGALWWDLCNRGAEITDRDLCVEYKNDHAFFWKIPFLMIKINPRRRFRFLPGSRLDTTSFLSVNEGSGHAG